MSATPAETAEPTAAQRRDVVFEVEHVTLRFGGVTSLNDVSFKLYRGEVLSVIGPNGAGKTSLFNCLTGVYHPQAGSIMFSPKAGPRTNVIGRKPYKISRLGVARTFQTSRMFSAMTTFENVKIGVESKQRTGPIGAMLRLPRTKREEHQSDLTTLELLEFVGLTRRANELASSLAYGDRRRLEIARALGTGPEVLLLDEPAAGTNPSEKLALAALIRMLSTELGITVLLIEHDMKLVMSVAERIIVLNFGQVIAHGSPAEIQRDPAVISAYLGSPEGEDAGPGEGRDAGATQSQNAGAPNATHSQNTGEPGGDRQPGAPGAGT